MNPTRVSEGSSFARAVQVSAATGISFVRNTFVNLGQTALGIGNDANAHASGVGLGASNIDVVGNVFTQLGGGAVVAGGVQADAHHPGNPAMTNADILVQARQGFARYRVGQRAPRTL